MKSLLLVVFTLSSIGLSAPYPMTGSSVYLNSKKNLFLHPFGFSFNLEKSKAQLLLNQNDLEKWSIRFSDSEQFFTMRVRNFSTSQDYEKSLRNWLREYQKSGLKIIQENIKSKRPSKGWIHLEDPLGRQILQYFTFVNLTWVYFGCVGNKNEVQILHQNCDYLNSQVIKLTE